MRAKRVRALRDVSRKTGVAFQQVKHAWTHRHIDARTSKDKGPAVPVAQQKSRFKGFKRNQPSYNKPVSAHPIRDALNVPSQFNHRMKLIRTHMQYLRVLPKMDLVNTLNAISHGKFDYL